MSNKHWWVLPDKGPPIVDSPVKHKKQRVGKKPFVVYRRYIGKPWGEPFMDKFWDSQREWAIYRRYKTESAARQSFDTIARKFRSKRQMPVTFGFDLSWEYRYNSETIEDGKPHEQNKDGQ